MLDVERRRMEAVVAGLSERFRAQLLAPAFPAPSLLELCAFRMARTCIG